MDCGLKEKDPSALRILCKVKVPDLAAEGTAVLPHRGAGTRQLVGSQDRAAGEDAGDPDPADAEQQKTGPSFRKGPVFVQSCAV